MFVFLQYMNGIYYFRLLFIDGYGYVFFEMVRYVVQLFVQVEEKYRFYFFIIVIM